VAPVVVFVLLAVLAAALAFVSCVAFARARLDAIEYYAAVAQAAFVHLLLAAQTAKCACG
jgi:hypothetical protein